MTIKKIIRAALKIPLTPFVLSFNLLMILTGFTFIFQAWLYDASDYEKSLNHDIIKDYISNLKNWFTTI